MRDSIIYIKYTSQIGRKTFWGKKLFSEIKFIEYKQKPMADSDSLLTVPSPIRRQFLLIIKKTPN